MKIKEAINITGGLSNPGKMPGYGYSLPAATCLSGRKYSKLENSVCRSCYAKKGRYTFSNVQRALHRRLQAIKDERWVEAMTTLIKSKETVYFRWHDSGDIVSEKYLKKIFEVCRNLPDIKFWLPTIERKLVLKAMRKGARPPDNLVIRFSSPIIGEPLDDMDELKEYSVDRFGYSFVTEDPSKVPKDTHVCPATVNHTTCNKCGCRECWLLNHKFVAYIKH